MTKVTVVMALEKATKNTYKYSVPEAQAGVSVDTIYIQKAAVGAVPPQSIKVTIEESK